MADHGKAGQPQLNGNGNGTNPLAGMSPWMRFVAIIGIPSAIALFLVFRLDGRQASQLERIEARLQAQTDTTYALTQTADASRRETAALVGLMRQICVNTSTSDTQRRECVR